LIYKAFLAADNENAEDWKELCYLWSSDFRTHITNQRWMNYEKRLNNEVGKREQIIQDYQQNVLEKQKNSFELIEYDKTVIIEGEFVKVILNKHKGISIKEYIRKSVSDRSLLGTLDHGFYDDISLGADYYSGHAVIEMPGEHKVTDLSKVQPEIYQTNNNVSLMNHQRCGDYTFQNNIIIDTESIIIEKLIKNSSAKKSIIRPFNITFNPEAWDRESLYIKTHNGGKSFEKFYLEGQRIAHGDIYSSIISARHGFGNTEGLFIVGDMTKSLSFKCDMSISALIPSIVYKEMNGTYFFRLQYSTREIDETLMVNSDEININCTLSVSIINKL